MRGALLKTYGKVNTFIGGIGATLNTPALVVAEIRRGGYGSGLLETDILGFKIVDNEVQFYTEKVYALGANAFKDNTDITWYLDNEDKCNSIGRQNSTANRTFYNAINLHWIWFKNPSIQRISQGTFLNCQIIRFDFPFIWDYYGSVKPFFHYIQSYDVPLLRETGSVYLGLSTTNVIPALWVNIPLCRGVIWRYKKKGLRTMVFPAITIVSQFQYSYFSSSVDYLDLPSGNIGTTQSNVFHSCGVFQVARFDTTTSFGNAYMCRGTTFKRLWIPRATYIGESSATALGGIGAGKLYVNPFLITSNNGGLNAALQVAINNGCTIVPVTNFDVPNEVTDLTGVSNFISGIGVNSLTKVINNNSWTDTFAVGAEKIIGNGKIEAKATATDKSIMMGLSIDKEANTWSDIDYALYIWNQGKIRVYENGVYTGVDYANYAIGDKFAVERIGTQVVYKKNDVIFKTSTVVPSTADYYAKVCFNTIDASLTNININGNTPAWEIAKGFEVKEVTLNFSEPLINTNANDFYEVWIKNIENDFSPLTPLPKNSLDNLELPAYWKWSKEIVASGETVMVLPDRKIEIKIFNCDSMYNKSLESNTLTIPI